MFDLLLTEIPSVNIVKDKLNPKNSCLIKSRYISPSVTSAMMLLSSEALLLKISLLCLIIRVNWDLML